MRCLHFTIPSFHRILNYWAKSTPIAVLGRGFSKKALKIVGRNTARSTIALGEELHEGRVHAGIDEIVIAALHSVEAFPR
jgi:hypothetical protein